MTDIFSPEKRSQVMSSIRSKNTKPELLVFRHLRKNRVYFQKHYRSREGIVMDLALPRKKKVVFIDGDFWHGRTLERVAANRGEDDFWTKKLRRNVERDEIQRKLLAENGWSVYTVWESELMKKKTQMDSLERIISFLEQDDESDFVIL
jgi:DNA mismatch endonuclease (patch repair protein)